MKGGFREFVDADSNVPFTVNKDAIRLANPAEPDGTILEMRDGAPSVAGPIRIRVAANYDEVKKWLGG